MIDCLLDRLGSYRLDAQVGESEIRFAQQGKSVSVNIDAIPLELTGTVVGNRACGRSAKQNVHGQSPTAGRSRTAIGPLRQSPLPAGRRVVIALPTHAILPRGELQGVFVVGNDGVVNFRLVKTGKTYGDRFQDISEHHAGERVATRGAERLNEGEKFRYRNRAMAEINSESPAGWPAAFIDSKLTPLIIAASILLGVGAVLLLPREEEPQIIVPMIDVFVQMPGASAKEVESESPNRWRNFSGKFPGLSTSIQRRRPAMRSPSSDSMSVRTKSRASCG